MKLSKMKLNMKLSKKDQMHLLRAIVIGLVLGLVLVVATDVVLESTGSYGFFGLFGMPVCGDGKCATTETSWCYADCGRPPGTGTNMTNRTNGTIVPPYPPINGTNGTIVPPYPPINGTNGTGNGTNQTPYYPPCYPNCMNGTMNGTNGTR